MVERIPPLARLLLSLPQTLPACLPSNSGNVPAPPPSSVTQGARGTFPRPDAHAIAHRLQGFLPTEACARTSPPSPRPSGSPMPSVLATPYVQLDVTSHRLDCNLARARTRAWAIWASFALM